ncbi:hypothetical protein JTE90_026462 [Oedothorax gibbosus]|uniref:Uncharacterized protein n=1 Tax=Oedothorax gibbosus TaxID=931172 RepID=A0AAV6VSA7_9ARAC|nr:hypothetical protein JTE90_026462 [Oedothorax gibbosus]
MVPDEFCHGFPHHRPVPDVPKHPDAPHSMSTTPKPPIKGSAHLPTRQDQRRQDQVLNSRNKSAPCALVPIRYTDVKGSTLIP